MKPEILVPSSSQDRAEYRADNSVSEHVLESVDQKSETQSIRSEIQSLTSFPAPSLFPNNSTAIDDSIVDAGKLVDDTSSSQTSASRGDIIEKAWVVRAKKIVDSTKDDPYQQESEISKLQIYYLKERYGRNVNPSD